MDYPVPPRCVPPEYQVRIKKNVNYQRRQVLNDSRVALFLAKSAGRMSRQFHTQNASLVWMGLGPGFPRARSVVGCVRLFIDARNDAH